MGPKWSICPEQKLFGKNHCYYFHLHIGPFHCAKFKKILTADPELWQCTIFGPKMVHLPPFFFFFFLFGKIITIILIYLLVPFIVQNLKEIFPVDPELWGCANPELNEDVQFLGPKWPISPNENCFRKPVHEPCFFYSCLSTCQKSKSDINLLVKYWWLKNTEISLTESHFCL